MAKPVSLCFTFDPTKSPLGPGGQWYSPEQTDCNGRKWSISITNGMEDDEGNVKLLLMNNNNQTFNVNYSFSVNSKSGNIVFCQSKSEDGEGGLLAIGPNTGRGWIYKKKYADFIRDGDLRISVVIQIQQEQHKFYSPPNNHSQKMLRLLESEEGADLLFDVKGTQILTHSQIVKAIAPILASCGTVVNTHKQKRKRASNGIVINDISVEVFRVILEWIYTGCYPGITASVKHGYGRELINAANKYELVELKMATENILVGECVMTKYDVSDYILFADSQSCPLLKEYAISLFRCWSEDLIRSEDSKQLRESGNLLHEALFSRQDGNVSDLRKELGKRKLDTDGMKEVLEARLQKAKDEETINLE